MVYSVGVVLPVGGVVGVFGDGENVFLGWVCHGVVFLFWLVWFLDFYPTTPRNRFETIWGVCDETYNNKKGGPTAKVARPQKHPTNKLLFLVPGPVELYHTATQH